VTDVKCFKFKSEFSLSLDGHDDVCASNLASIDRREGGKKSHSSCHQDGKMAKNLALMCDNLLPHLHLVVLLVCIPHVLNTLHMLFISQELNS